MSVRADNGGCFSAALPPAALSPISQPGECPPAHRGPPHSSVPRHPALSFILAPALHQMFTYIIVVLQIHMCRDGRPHRSPRPPIPHADGLWQGDLRVLKRFMRQRAAVECSQGTDTPVAVTAGRKASRRRAVISTCITPGLDS